MVLHYPILFHSRSLILTDKILEIYKTRRPYGVPVHIKQGLDMA